MYIPDKLGLPLGTSVDGQLFSSSSETTPLKSNTHTYTSASHILLRVQTRHLAHGNKCRDSPGENEHLPYKLLEYHRVDH